MTQAAQLIEPLDFKAAGGGDPEVWREFLTLRRAERGRRDACARGADGLSGVGDIVPETFHPTPPDLLLACARQRVFERRARRAAPEGLYAAALLEIGRALKAACVTFEEARAAHARCFTTERARCAEKAAELAALADRLKAAALDADLATEA